MKYRLLFRWIGISLTAIGTVFLFSWNTILSYFINREMSLFPGSKAYELWKKSPVPVVMDMFVFNCTNPDQLLEKNYKPEVVQMGPYRFHEIDEKVNITWNPNHTVTYQNVRRWNFDPENSNGSLNDIVTTLNVVPVGVSFMTRYWNDLLLIPISAALEMFEKTMWVTTPVSEYLIDGYKDPLVSMASRFPWLSSLLASKDRIGLLYGRNNSATFDGVFNVETGVDDLTKRGILRYWNYKNSTSYDGECGGFGTSVVDSFPPGRTKHTILETFMSDVCRSLPFEYLDDMTVDGVVGYRYGLSKNFFVNGTSDPGTACEGEEHNLPQGVVNMSVCQHGAPLFTSSPHFFHADPYYVNQVAGLQPEADKHQFYITLEPTTGIPLDITARLQLNLLLQPNPRIRMFAGVPEILFPIVWVETRVTVSPELATFLRTYTFLPTASLICSVGLLLTGLLTLGLTFLPQTVRSVSEDNRRNRIEDSGTGKVQAEKQTFPEENNTLLHTEH
jgi:hypothetical protein